MGLALLAQALLPFVTICQLLFVGKDLLVGFSEQDRPLPFLGIESRLGQSV
jgi:hypothetical protein